MITHSDLSSVAYAKQADTFSFGKRSMDVWWPFWAWRVVAPTEPRETDVFKELVLRLLKTGSKDLSAVSRMTGLHKDFVLHIITVLQSEELLNELSVTEKGIKELEVGYEDNSEIRTYTILQDASSGQLVPRVFNHLDYIDGVKVEGMKVSYLKNRGKSTETRPFVLRSANITPEQPAVDLIYDAVRQHRVDRNKLRQAGFDYSSVELREGAVDYLVDSPEAVFMHLQIFLDSSADRQWCISDPAGLFPSMPVLNRAADEKLQSDKFFAQRIDQLLGIASETSNLDYQAHDRLLDEKAKSELSARFPWASHIPLVESTVLEMLRDHYDLEEYGDKSNKRLKTLSRSLQNVCEAIIKVLLQPNPSLTQWKRVDLKGKERRHQIKAIYLASSKAVNDELAWNLSSIGVGQIRAAMEKGEQSLRQLTAALVLVKPAVVDEVEEELSGWLTLLMELARRRNSAGHANLEVLDDSCINNDFVFVTDLLKVIERKL